MRHIKLMFDDEKFQKLKTFKEKKEETSKERISWEDFIYKQVLK